MCLPRARGGEVRACECTGRWWGRTAGSPGRRDTHAVRARHRANPLHVHPRNESKQGMAYLPQPQRDPRVWFQDPLCLPWLREAP